MTELPSYQDFEVEARKWCHIDGLDPDGRVSYPDPNGYAVARYRSRWAGYAIELRDHWMKTALVSMFTQRMRSQPLQ